MASIAIDVIKMKQTQDKNGHVLYLRLNPADVDAVAAVSLTPVGSQFKMQLTDLDDDGNPEKAGETSGPAREAGLQQPQQRIAPASRYREGYVQGHRKGMKDADEDTGLPTANDVRGIISSRKPVEPDKRLVRQAAIACNNPVFRAWLWENDMIKTVDDAEEAAVAVRLVCRVQSRKEFVAGTTAGNRWEELYGKFIAWRDVPEAAE